MQKYKIILSGGLFFLTGFLFSQNFNFAFMQNVPVVQNNQVLTNPWAGSWNCAQFSTMKLDNDKLEDLVVFDKSTNKFTTFLTRQSTKGKFYQHSPQYELVFPDSLYYWALLADYNNDGKKDLFTYTNGGIKVFKNISLSSGIKWEIASDLLLTQGFTGLINLLVNPTDIPSFVDMDGDGDLDVMCYAQGGGFIEYHKNLSIEKYRKADSLVFKKVNVCWGKFQESFSVCGGFSFGIDCSPLEGKIAREENEFSTSTKKVQHSGSTILMLDLDGDGDKDALSGFVTCNNLYAMINNGTKTSANITYVNENFPADKPAIFNIFPASFYEDLDFDGKKDLIVSPNTFINEGNQMDFKHSGWFYKNIGSRSAPVFNYRQPDFLQNSMIELGENASPTMADIDGDGDMDLLIGHKGNLINNNFYATLLLYENIGNKKEPSFILKSEDFMGLSYSHYSYLKPYFTDINQDGAIDLVFTGTPSGNKPTQLNYFINLAPESKAIKFNTPLQNIPLSLSVTDNLCLYDIDNDGHIDLLLGKARGNLEFYKNTGENKFVKQSDTFLGIDDNIYAHNLALAITDADNNGKPDLITGDDSGLIKIYGNFLDNLSTNPKPTTEILLDSLANKYSHTRLGANLFPSFADLDGNGLAEMVVGLKSGGVYIFKNIADNKNIPPSLGNGPFF